MQSIHHLAGFARILVAGVALAAFSPQSSQAASWAWDFEAESLGATTSADIVNGLTVNTSAGQVNNTPRFGSHGSINGWSTAVDDPISLANLTAFTLSLWVKPFNGNYGGINGVLFERLYNGSAFGTGFIGISIGGGAQPYAVVGGTYLYAGGPNSGYLPIDFGIGYPALKSEWTHLAITYDGGNNTLQWYWNGQLGNSNTGMPSSIPGSLAGNGSLTRFGEGGSNLPSLDEVAFLDTALSQAQIHDVYNNGIASVVPEPSAAALLCSAAFLGLLRRRVTPCALRASREHLPN